MAQNEPHVYMSERDQALAAIARLTLRIPTLEVRNSDSQDFHDVGVAGLRDALEQAWAAGAKAAAGKALAVCEAISDYSHNVYDDVSPEIAAIVADARAAIEAARGE